jgi:SAM-dependent methyltransferase
MNIVEKATVIHYHRHRIAQYRAGTVESLGWRGPESQLRRFEVLSGIGDFNDRSVLDAGCGYGDLKAWLDRRFTGFTYLGVDQMPEFIEQARQRWADKPDTYFVHSDFARVPMPESDYVIASGALGYRCANPGFYFETIARLYAGARIALGFNMLDVALFPPDDLLVGHDRGAVAQFCGRLCADVRIIDGYLPDDFTVFMMR